jgi:microcystin degradation protein MlrC
MSAVAARQGLPRIAVAGISHESNSFSSSRTTLADFGWPGGVTPEDALRHAAREYTTVSGYVEGARQFGLDLYPTVIAAATPKGPVADDAFEALAGELVRRLRAAPPLDGVLLALHGAMVVESHPSGDAEIVRRVREVVGPDLPVVVSHDFHANVTPEIVARSTALVSYQENPHVDTRERGARAARIMADTVRGAVTPVQALAKPPMVYNIMFQYTKREPLRSIVEESRRLEAAPRVLAASVLGGYQYADVPAMGPSAVVVADGDRAAAEREARRLADMLWATRERLILDLPDAEAAVHEAAHSDRCPVVLMDLGDNIGGGSAGDSTFLLAELLRQEARGWVVTIADPEAVQSAFQSGVGGTFDGWVGGKTDRLHGEPVRMRGRIRSLHDGQYFEPEVRHGGTCYHDMGRTAVVTAEGSTLEVPSLLVLTTERSSPNSLHQLTSCGIRPGRQRILVVKGAIAPRAAYEPIAARIIEVDTGGATAVNPARFTYRRVRRPLFGLDRWRRRGEEDCRDARPCRRPLGRRPRDT